MGPVGVRGGAGANPARRRPGLRRDPGGSQPASGPVKRPVQGRPRARGLPGRRTGASSEGRLRAGSARSGGRAPGFGRYGGKAPASGHGPRSLRRSLGQPAGPPGTPPSGLCLPPSRSPFFKADAIARESPANPPAPGPRPRSPRAGGKPACVCSGSPGARAHVEAGGRPADARRRPDQGPPSRRLRPPRGAPPRAAEPAGKGYGSARARACV